MKNKLPKMIEKQIWNKLNEFKRDIAVSYGYWENVPDYRRAAIEFWETNKKPYAIWHEQSSNIRETVAAAAAAAAAESQEPDKTVSDKT